jgi:hypothetical protein
MKAQSPLRLHKHDIDAQVLSLSCYLHHYIAPALHDVYIAILSAPSRFRRASASRTFPRGVHFTECSDHLELPQHNTRGHLRTRLPFVGDIDSGLVRVLVLYIRRVFPRRPTEFLPTAARRPSHIWAHFLTFRSLFAFASSCSSSVPLLYKVRDHRHLKRHGDTTG